MKQILSDQEAMLWAIREAQLGRGWVSPNPVVGCCIVDSSSRLLSVGAHLKFGDKHAEANALDKIQDKSQLKGASVFVTLEPCSHVGNQPSCAHTLAKFPIKRVVYLVADPNPVAEGGAGVLADAEIQVERMPALMGQGEKLAEVFLTNQRRNRAFYHLKVAASLDGQIANASGESQWITGEESRYRVQQMRGEHDAVLVGRGTFEADAPRLNSRHEQYSHKENWAIVLDPDGKLAGQLESSSLAKVRPSNKIVWVTDLSIHSPSELKVEHLKVSREASAGLDMNELGEKLLQRGICSVLVEGGAGTFASFFNQSMCDRLSVFQSMSLIGSKSSLSWSSAFETHDLPNRPFLHQLEMETLGGDILLSGIISKS